ncbi:unnamed protein product [Parnassius apollo]|uniref:(apollo) hypothetical protein n=1 Tax=Parnassius apollo TaxID=110799 RepID=A0A8S3WDJ2_PARAO|nr:unnamed protein product [Parnassius apollo]
MTPYHRMLPSNHAMDGGLRTSTTGQQLPNARTLRVALMSDGRVHNKRFTQLITYLPLIMTADTTTVHDTINYVLFTRTCCAPGGELNPMCMPIEVPTDDLHLRRSNVRCLNLTRAITYQALGCAPNSLPPERINTSPPLLDLSSLYGNDQLSVNRSRQMRGGLLRADVIKGKEWPPNGNPVCFLNQPPRETRCHDSGHFSINSLVGIQLLGIWQYRNHNYLARILQQINPCWDDQTLFTVARDINIAYYQHIVYYELMPALMGHEFLLRNNIIYNTYGHVDDYDDSLEPRVSIEYVMGTRWFHSIQEGRLQLYSKEGRLLDELAMVDYSLRPGGMMINNTFEGATQGSFRQPCADVDYLVDPDVGERILGPLQFASDVTASDINKGRDMGLPSYNKYRQYCGLPVAKTFDDLYNWMPKDQVDVLARTYEYIDDLDLMAGILAEKPMHGAIMGPTLACIMADQLLRWRRADRFWYENSIHPGAFTPDQLYEIRKISMARIICDHGDSVDSVQPFAFLLPGIRNEIVDCSTIPAPNLETWRDQRCAVNVTSENFKPTLYNLSDLTLDDLTGIPIDYNQF